MSSNDEIQPPPSMAQLVQMMGNKPTNNHQWLTWFNNLYRYLEVTLKSGYVSESNASTTAINTGSNYTGTWEDVGAYNSLTVAVKTDQDGYFEVQFSPDGTNIDSTLTRYYRTDQIEPPHRFTITRRYMRVIFYNNSGSNQTYFRLQTLIGEKNDLNIPIDSIMSQDYDSISVRPTSFAEEVALSRRQGWATWNKFGYNDDIDNSGGGGVPEVIASYGGAFNAWTSAELIDIVSDSASDSSNSVYVIGLDANGDQLEAAYNLNGTTTVTSTGQTWLGINRVYVLGGQNVGNITITGNTSTNPWAHIPSGGGVSQQCIFYVPNNHTFLATWLHCNVRKLAGAGGSPRATIRAWAYSKAQSTTYEVARIDIDTGVENTIELRPTEPFPLGENQIFYLEGETDTNNTFFSARFSGKLVRDVNA